MGKEAQLNRMRRQAKQNGDFFEGAAVPEAVKEKIARDAKLVEEKATAAAALKEKSKLCAELRVALKKRTIKYEKEYRNKEAQINRMRRQSKQHFSEGATEKQIEKFGNNFFAFGPVVL